ncbi:MAG TPA: peptide ABC transporter substrate-binding protein [Chloroflexota bacterium]|nr:peptide ABC transporter substrate-binding protein [Chloroflexota bacterium]
MAHLRLSLVGGVILALLTACSLEQSRPGPRGSTTGDGQKSAAPKRVTAAIMGDPVSPFGRLSGFGQRGADAVEELVQVGLTNMDRQGMKQPVLAEAVPTVENGLWRVFPDGRMETTWKIKSGAKWHDGGSVTTDDLLFAVQVGQDPDVPEFGDAAFAAIDWVEAVDDRTVTVHWMRPYIEADAMFATRSYATPLPKRLLAATYDNNKANFTQAPYFGDEFVGSGPFRVREFSRGSSLVLDAFDDYVLGRPKIDTIEIQFVADPTTIVARLLAGDVILTLGKTLSVEEALEVRAQWRDGKVDMAPANAVSIYPQFLNPNPVVVTDVRFRRALLHAIDRQQLVDVLLGGQSSVAESFMFPNQPQYQEIEARLPRYAYDPRRASQMIEEIGYTKGADGFFVDADGQPLSVEIRATTTDINQKSMFSVADQWQKIGVKVDPVTMSRQRAADNSYVFTFPAFYLQRYTSDLPGLKNLHSSRNPLPENNFRSGNTSRYKNPEFDALLDQYFATVPTDERVRLLGQIIYHIADQVTQLGLFFDAEPTMIGSHLVNVTARQPEITQAWNAQTWDIQ